MLKSLTLQNFRGFSDHRIEFGPETILIGQNNAGKTTIIEALRVLSVAQMRVHSANLIGCPVWLDGFCQGAGFKPSLETIDFDFENVQHAYAAEKPAIIKAKLRNNNEIHIYIGTGSEQVFCQLRLGPNRIVHSRSDIRERTFGSTRVMPPIGSLLPREKHIAKGRLNRYLDGYLAYRHFRNQLWERPSDYRKFVKLLEDTWTTAKIHSFENDHGAERNQYSLLVREGKFTSEISWHGHGLQAWMQTAWFLARVPSDCTIVLDEPDVYLHADIQRKLIKVIESLKFNQSIVATHSSEIISDVPTQSVVLVQKRNRVSKPSENTTEIQKALRTMGSLHSIQLSKIAERGRVLIVEGQDRRFLLDVAFKLGPKVFDRFNQLAVMELGGKGNWTHALGAAEALNKTSAGAIQTSLILDSDYMLDEEKKKFNYKAETCGLDLHIWQKKEIENYFICDTAISRYISERVDHAITELDTWLLQTINSIQEKMYQDLVLSYSDVIQKHSHPKIDTKAAFRKANDLVESKLESQILSDLISAKDLFSALTKCVSDKFGVSFSALAICKEMRASEYPVEITTTIIRLTEPTAV